jgi:electron-transferring-flavoprotein dehydrogenase
VGTLMNGLEQYALRGHMPWTLHRAKPDHVQLKPAAECKPIDYPKPDGKLTFDRLSSVFISNTNHEENQPAHLTLKDATVPVRINLPQYAGPEGRYCPAGVYEFVPDEAQGGGASGCRSTRRTACTARPATSRTRRRTSSGSRPRAAAAQLLGDVKTIAPGAWLAGARGVFDLILTPGKVA